MRCKPFRWPLTIALSLGCANTATIRRNNGPDLEAQIVSADPGALNVAGSDGVYRIPREDVYDIDHPGNVTLGVGVGLLALAVVAFAALAANGSLDRGTGPAVGSLLAAPGAGLTFFGSVIYLRSKHASAAFEDQPRTDQPPAPLPIVRLPAGMGTP